jgi:16S rRNA (adenine1518-N6/adenine1519-N6)-dimethyltransferase
MYDLTDPAVIKYLLTRRGFSFSKGLGQNFIIDPGVCPKMADLSGAGQANGALEIGPGIGVLTCELARRAKKVVAVELDERLIPVLRETLAGFDNVKIIHADALKLDLAELIDAEFGGSAAVCANLPYYITSPLIMKLLEERLPISTITVMVQKEAAERLTAAPGTRAAGAVSYAVDYYSRAEILFGVGSESFMPRPKVDSSVIRLDVRSEPKVAAVDEKLMFRLIRCAFNQRRKTVLNALGSGGGFGREATAQALAACGIDPASRGERLTLEDFSRLAGEFARLC